MAARATPGSVMQGARGVIASRAVHTPASRNTPKEYPHARSGLRIQVVSVAAAPSPRRTRALTRSRLPSPPPVPLTHSVLKRCRLNGTPDKLTLNVLRPSGLRPTHRG